MPSQKLKTNKYAIPKNISVCQSLLQSFNYLHSREGYPWRTLLAVSANSETTVKAALLAAKKANCPIIFAATLNQVDTDRGYTGWNHENFVSFVRTNAKKIGYKGIIVFGIDHAGPWCKDKHSSENWPYIQTMNSVKRSLSKAIRAGFDLLHIDPTIDKESSTGEPEISAVVDRTVELIGYCEKVRQHVGMPPICYEVGTEEVKGGLTDEKDFHNFINNLRWRLLEAGLNYAWPCFIVGKVGTNLYQTNFDFDVASRLTQIATNSGLALKGHYTDNVNNPELYPKSCIGGANVGPEFTQVEYEAIQDLKKYKKYNVEQLAALKEFNYALKSAVIRSRRWKKWLLHGEEGKSFNKLSEERQHWLFTTGARYVWAEKGVTFARQKLYQASKSTDFNPDEFVVQHVADRVYKYLRAFNLEGTLPLLEKEFHRRNKLPFWGTGEIICSGEALVEIMRPGIDQPLNIPGKFIGPFPSGAPAICADALAKIEKKVGFVSSVGEDGFGKLLVNRLATDGVYAGMINKSPHKTTGCAFVMYTRDGSRNFIFHINRTASDDLKISQRTLEMVASFRHCHLMGCSLSISKTMRDSCLKIARTVKHAGGTISLDPNIRPELQSIEECRKVFLPVLTTTDIILPGKDEVILLTGEHNLAKACNQLLQMGMKIVVLKMGKKGCRVYTKNESIDVPGFNVNEVDPTGAGDCFDAGFLSAYLDGMPLYQAARLANALGALAATRQGPMEGTFSIKEIMVFINSQEKNG